MEAENITKTKQDKVSLERGNEKNQSENNRPGSISDNNKKNNKMRSVEIEKLVLNCGGIDDKLEKSVKLLEMITKGRKIYRIKATRRIPDFGISPGKIAGCKVTIRNKNQIKDLLKRFFAALNNQLRKKQIVENHVSFGIREYIEVPGLEYSRDIGILEFEATVVFKRKGRSVKMKKNKRGKLPRKQWVSREEIIEYLNKNLGVEVV